MDVQSVFRRDHGGEHVHRGHALVAEIQKLQTLSARILQTVSLFDTVPNRVGCGHPVDFSVLHSMYVYAVCLLRYHFYYLLYYRLLFYSHK